MKKILIGFLVIVILIIAASYIFIPGTIQISSRTPTNCVPKNMLSVLNNPSTWSRWWPGDTKQTASDSSFIYNSYLFKLSTPYSDGAAIDLSDEKKVIPTKILLLPVTKDSILVSWETSFATSFNPVTRISQYFEARSIKKSMDDVLKSLVDFAGQTKNIYGFTIKRTTFRHTVLLATKSYSKTYPSIEMIYQKIDTLHNYIAAQNAKEADPPMLHISSIDSTGYELFIAIPINKKIEPGKNMFISMMVPMEGRFLETQFSGGPATIQKAHQAVSAFMEDRMLTPPAIPFEVLITDRRNEPDTSKWMTKIFYPTMWN